MGRYAVDPLWADVDPLPLDEGGPNPLAAIAYSEEYEETMSYLRAVMAANEYSPRVLTLTEDLIAMNPAHYTVWLYRAACLFALGDIDFAGELAWLNETALAHQKNYQIWHHRQLLVDKRGSGEGESAFVGEMLALDAKNYHVWSYRQWLVQRFELWDKGELEFTEHMLSEDVRNNSAWNHRWYIINGRPDGQDVKNLTIQNREIEFAQKAVAQAPQNPCPWNYLRAIFKRAALPLSGLKPFVAEYADPTQQHGVRSSHALDLLADILAERDETKAQAAEALNLLAQTYDPIRKNYWEYRKSLLGPLPASASTAA